MLYEIEKATLKDGKRNRRWFTCDLLDLYVWFNERNIIEKFQICIKPEHSISSMSIMKEDVVTWECDLGFTFDMVMPTQRYKTPILEKNEDHDTDALIHTFSKASINIDENIKIFIDQKLNILKDK